MLRVFEKASSLLLNTTLFGLIGLGLLVVGSLLPIFGSHRVFVVQSGSMEPSIPIGSLIFVSRSDTYRAGDVVTWKPARGGIPVTHRISRELPDSRIQTRGDANQVEDAPIDIEQIVGRVSFSVPYLGYPVAFAKKPWGFMLLIVFPSLFIITDEVLALRRSYSRMRYRKMRGMIVSERSYHPLHRIEAAAQRNNIRGDISPTLPGTRESR